MSVPESMIWGFVVGYLAMNAYRAWRPRRKVDQMPLIETEHAPEAKPLDRLWLTPGAVIHVDGLPFAAEGGYVYGRLGNAALTNGKVLPESEGEPR